MKEKSEMLAEQSKLVKVQDDSRPTIELVTVRTSRDEVRNQICPPNCIPNCMPSCPPTIFRPPPPPRPRPN